MSQHPDRPADADIRPGELVLPLPAAVDAGVYFLGVIRTPWPTRRDCPRRGDPIEGPDCRIEVDARWTAALDGVAEGTLLQVLYWMHLSRRDLARQRPRSADRATGTFALRSPMRPNPIASSAVRLLRRDGNVLTVRGLDCVDGTPLIDIKPERCPVIEPGRAG